MKIAVTGKGGVGKTTFAATLARLYAAEGRPKTWLQIQSLYSFTASSVCGFFDNVIFILSVISKLYRYAINVTIFYQNISEDTLNTYWKFTSCGAIFISHIGTVLSVL